MTEKVKSDVSEERPDNPTYINLKTRIFVAESEIKNLEKSRMEVEASIEEYQKRIERTPLVEKEYAELTRGL
jgi:succinoglycan biosynthesis transport protein ExoP